MSTQEYTTRYYRLTCDRCGAIGPKGEIEQDALEAAALEDWQRVTWYTGIRYRSDDYCPTCWPEWEREQEEAHGIMS